MRTSLFLMAGIVATALAASADAQIYSRGSYNGFAANPAETFTAVGGPDNLYTKSYAITGAVATATTLPASTVFEGKAANSDYSVEGPQFGGNVKFATPASGTFSFNFYDKTSWSDGWSPSDRRRIGYTGQSFGFDIMGSWDAFGSPTVMSLNAGVYEGSVVLTAGPYNFKFRKNNDWSINIGDNGFANDAGNINYTAADTGTYTFRLDVANGRWQIIPAPGAAALMGLGGLMMARRRR